MRAEDDDIASDDIQLFLDHDFTSPAAMCLFLGSWNTYDWSSSDIR